MNIYVGNLDFKTKENDLEVMFAEFGAVSTAKIINDKFNGRSKGFGFIEMEDDAAATQAIQKLNGTTFGSRALIVNEAKPKKTDF